MQIFGASSWGEIERSFLFSSHSVFVDWFPWSGWARLDDGDEFDPGMKLLNIGLLLIDMLSMNGLSIAPNDLQSRTEICFLPKSTQIEDPTSKESTGVENLHELKIHYKLRFNMSWGSTWIEDSYELRVHMSWGFTWVEDP